MIALAPGIVNCKCKFCSHCETIEVPQRDLDMFNDGMASQDAFPYLDGLKRKFISLQICPKCYTERYLAIGNIENHTIENYSRFLK